MANLQFKGDRRSKVYSAQFNAIAYANKNGVLSGCEVTKTGGQSRDVTVANGSIFFGLNTSEISTGDLTIDASDSNGRVDLILTDADGVLSVVKGTPSGVPASPEYDPETHICLAIIEVRANSTNVLATDILDNRVENTGGGAGSGGGTFLRKVVEFTTQTSVTVNHNFGDSEPFVFVYDNSNELIIPDTITIDDSSAVTVTFATSTTGKIIVTGGSGVNNAYYSEDFTSQTSLTINHNLGNKNVFVSVVDGSGSDIIPSDITRTDENNVSITFGTSQTGTVFIAGGISTENIPEVYNESENHVVNVSDVSTNQSFTVNNTYSITLTNTGNSNAYITFGATATVTDFPIYPDRSLTFENVDFGQISSICDTSESTSLRVNVLSTNKEGKRKNFEVLSISTTDVNATDSFSSTNTKDIIVTNEGVNDTFFDFNTTSSTNDIILNSEKYYIINNTKFSDIAAINNATETSTIKVIGLW